MSLLKPNPAAVNAIRQILGEGEERMLEATAKRLARGITEPGWAERKLAEVQGLQAEIRRQFQDTYQGVAVHLEETIKDGLAGGPNISANLKATEALVDETLFNVRSTEFRILRGHQDLYRQVVARASAVQTTGSTTVRQAAQAVMGQLSEQGVTAFVDKRGRSWKLGTYSEMAVRTATARAQVGARLNEYVEDGHKLVIVSNSPNECPRCRKWEGRVLAIDAGNLTSTDLYEADGTVKEAQSEGLFHPNCTHDLRPYVPGLTKRDPEVGFPTSEDAARLRKKGAAARQRKEAARRREAGEAPFGESPELQATRAKARAAEAESAKLQAKIAAEAKQKAEQEAKAVKKKAANPKVSKGDKPGHPFRGNQHTGGNGGAWASSVESSYMAPAVDVQREIAAFDALPSSAKVKLYHGTTADNATSIKESGRAGHNPRGDSVSELTDGKGLYVAPTFNDARNYAGPGGRVVELEVKRGDVIPSPEASSRGKTTGQALYHSFEGAILKDNAKLKVTKIRSGVS